jgi:hypothetical protein
MDLSVLERNSIAAPGTAGKGRLDLIQQWTGIVFLILLAYLPYAEFVHDQLGITILGYGAEVTIVPTAIAMLLFAIIGVFRQPRLLLYPIAVIVLGGIVIAFRYYWGLDHSAIDSAQQAVAMRYMILIPCYILIAGYVFQNADFRKYAPVIIIVNAAVNAIVGILYTAGLLNYKVVSQESDLYGSYLMGETTRSSGLYAGVNVFANTLVLALLLACFFLKLSPLLRSIAIALIVLGILVSQSRWPLFAAGVLLTIVVIGQAHSFTKRFVQVSVLLFLLVLAAAFTSDQTRESLFGVRSRIAVDSWTDIQGRLSKYMVGVNAIFEESRTPFVGARPESLNRGSALEDVFSDNGLLSMVIRSGIPVSIFFFLLCYFALKRYHIDTAKTATRLFWLIAGGTLLLNNAVYWDSWLFHAAVVYRLLPDAILESPRAVLKSTRILPQQYQSALD